MCNEQSKIFHSHDFATFSSAQFSSEQSKLSERFAVQRSAARLEVPMTCGTLTDFACAKRGKERRERERVSMCVCVCLPAASNTATSQRQAGPSTSFPPSSCSQVSLPDCSEHIKNLDAFKLTWAQNPHTYTYRRTYIYTLTYTHSHTHSSVAFMKMCSKFDGWAPKTSPELLTKLWKIVSPPASWSWRF